jgi:hypothetical protein
MMNDMSIEKQDGAANEERMVWVRPEVNRIRAGDAENAGAGSLDGGAGLS